MNFLLAYTLKHRELPDTFSDHYIIYNADEFEDPLTSCSNEYEKLINEEGKDFEHWYLFHACISVLIKSTDL